MVLKTNIYFTMVPLSCLFISKVITKVQLQFRARCLSLSRVFSFRREIWVHGVVVMLVGLVKSVDYYALLLLFHMGALDTARGVLRLVTRLWV